MKNSKKKKQKLAKNVESDGERWIEESVVAYDVANDDSNKASEILRRGLVDSIEDSFFCSPSYSWSGGSSSNGVSSGLELGLTSGSSDGFLEQICREDVVWFEGVNQKQNQKQKRIIAATGTVSTILGNEYVRRNSGRKKRIRNEVVDKDEAEQFLYSMLENDCDLNFSIHYHSTYIA